MEIDALHLHHAYLVVGSWEASQDKILSLIKVQRENNPDLFIYESLGIDDARSLTSRALLGGLNGKKIFLVNAAEPTLPAQNALLKTLEEPVADSHFFLIAPYEDILLPTLRSRMRVLKLSENEEVNSAEKFLSIPIDKKLLFATKFGDTEEPLGPFLDDLLKQLKKVKADSEVIKKVFKIRRFADDPSAMPRLLLEHIALIV